MEFTLKCILTTVLILQVTLVGIYFVFGGVYVWPLTFMVGSVTPLVDPTAMTDIREPSQILPGLQKEKTGNTTTQRLPLNTTNHPTFQTVDEQAAWVFSAFFDYVDVQNGDPVIKVLGLLKSPSKVFCSLTDGNKTSTSNGYVIFFFELHATDHLPVEIKCPFSANIRPTHVSISFKADRKPTNRLQILYPGPRIRNFTVCYSVLHSGFNNTMQLIESIEINRILGAEHFMIYPYSFSPEVNQIISRYQQDGIMTVFKWPLPTTTIRNYGQILALNDCKFRNRNTSRFVVLVDTDEIVVPRTHKSWMELIHAVSPHEQDVSRLLNPSSSSDADDKLTACFMVRSTYFTIDWAPKWSILPPQLVIGKAEQLNISKYGMRILSQHWRQDIVLPSKNRSKYMARPELLVFPDHHFAKKLKTNTSCLTMNESLGILHHYRAWPISGKYMIDTSALKHKDTLYRNIMSRVLQFPNIFP